MKNKIVNHFIGVYDHRDEYQKQEIYKELAFSGILLYFLVMLLMFISLLIDLSSNTLSFVTLALFVITMFYSILIVVRLRKKQLDETDCATMEEYMEKRNRLRIKSTLAGIFWALSMLILMQFIVPFLSTGELDVSIKQTILWCIAGIFFGVTMYQFSKSKLKKHY